MPDDNDGAEAAEYSSEKMDVPPELDPELQSFILDQMSQLKSDPFITHDRAVGEIVVDVIAKLHRLSDKVEGLEEVQRIGKIVTGMVRVADIKKVREQVFSLKAARRLNPTLGGSVFEIEATPSQLSAALPGSNPPDGSGVVIGFVDQGCDFAHPHFLKGDRTRLLALWDQRGGLTDDSPPGYGYGREFEDEDINEALTGSPPATTPHDALGYGISENAHGTHVMDAAAGSGGEFGSPGVAPGADIIFVESATNHTTGTDESFGNSRRLLEAVKYIFDKAASRGRDRVVVNISLNGDGGPHDGSTLVEEAFDCLLETPGRAIVIAAGNSRETLSHVRRLIHPGQTRTLFWEILAEDDTSNKVEIWYDGRRSLSVSLRLPAKGITLGPFMPGEAHTVSRNTEAAGHVIHRRQDPLNGDNHVLILFGGRMEAGEWLIDLSPLDDESSPFEIDAWIEKDSGGNLRSRFTDARPSDNVCTIGTLSCGRSTIAVGAYEVDFDGVSSILPDSSEGPTRDGKLKPELSAPGGGVRTAMALTHGVGESGGTSIAAPHVTGVIALLMQAAGAPLPIERIRDLIINRARKAPPTPGNVWDTCFGVGRISAFSSLQALAPPPPPPFVLEHSEIVVVEVTSSSVTSVTITTETVSIKPAEEITDGAEDLVGLQPVAGGPVVAEGPDGGSL